MHWQSAHILRLFTLWNTGSSSGAIAGNARDRFSGSLRLSLQVQVLTSSLGYPAIFPLLLYNHHNKGTMVSRVRSTAMTTNSISKKPTSGFKLSTVQTCRVADSEWVKQPPLSTLDYHSRLVVSCILVTDQSDLKKKKKREGGLVPATRSDGLHKHVRSYKSSAKLLQHHFVSRWHLVRIRVRI